jgi:hypothetical protein
MTDIKDVRERIARAIERDAWAALDTPGLDSVLQQNRRAGSLMKARAALATLTLSDHIAAVEPAGIPVLKLLADAVDVIACLRKHSGAFDVEATLAELNAAIALIMASRDVR